MKKIKLNSEIMYVVSNVLMALSVAMLSSVDFGLSMIPAPAYILSQKIQVLTFGQCEYIIQFLVFVLLCVLMKRFRFSYLCAFLTGVFYATVLDLFRMWIPLFNPDITVPGSYALWLRIVLFIVGEIITGCAVALYFKVYIPPQVYDFFVRTISKHFNIDQTKFKRGFDFTCLAVSVVLTLSFFGKFVGVKWGTFVIAIVNAYLIGFFVKLFDKYFEFVPAFKKFANKVNMDTE